MKSFKINVNPKILKWSIETMNIPEEKIIKSLNINENVLNNWLNNREKLTYVQLQKFSKLAGMSPLIFLSDKVPEEKPGKIFRDYNENNKKSYKTLKTIKRIEFLQNIAGELYDNINKSKEADIEKYNVGYKPEDIAIIERKKFSNFSEQKKFRSVYEALNKFKSEVENNNIIIMQFPFNDIRGFSLIDKKPYFIVLNSKENPESRIFTLFHEYAHLLLYEDELNTDNSSKDDEIETWCNNFASYFLLTDDIIKECYNKFDGSVYDKAHKISSQYKLSHSMIFYRFYKLGYTNEDTFKKYVADSKIIDNTRSGGNYITKIKSNYGDRFINLVFENYRENEITLSDVLTYLDIKLESMHKLRGMMSP